VLDNIRYGNPRLSEAEVRQVLARLDCLDLIESLPSGLRTEVGEKGSGLSLGQKQLVCFARALAADPAILILDEATSAVDTLTEQRLQAALETLLAGRTSFVVAHRLSTVRHADLVLVLEQGRIVERGTHTSLLAAGGLSAFFGVVFALAQHDLKKLLAYHSIENIGIILLGLGLAMAGRATGRADWVVLGMAGCLLHVWNHALFKSLLFFGAGSVLHATGSREIDLQGGLAKRMPATAGLFLVGAVAICALPPLNGFVSELAIFLGLARAALGPGPAWAALPAAALAATGALAVACFVKVYGIVFLGTPRSEAAAAAKEAPAPMLRPMALLAAACVAIGIAPGLFAPAVDRGIAAWAEDTGALLGWGRFLPLGRLAVVAALLILLTALISLRLAPLCRRARERQPELPTWDCGFAGASPRLQYTASSFAELITSRFGWVLAPRFRWPRIEGPFPEASSFHSEIADSVLERLLRPGVRWLVRLSERLRRYHQGSLQQYLLYVVIALVILLLVSLQPWWPVERLGGS